MEHKAGQHEYLDVPGARDDGSESISEQQLGVADTTSNTSQSMASSDSTSAENVAGFDQKVRKCRWL